MKFFKRKSGGIGIWVIVLLAITLSILLVLPSMARWVVTEVWVDEGSYYDTTNQVWVFIGYMESTVVWVDDGSSTIDPIDTTSGNNYFTDEGIFILCPGISLEMNLGYQSITNRTEGRLGRGWHHSYEWDLDIQDDQAVLNMGSGNQLIFTENTNGSYLPPVSHNWTLEGNGNGHEVGLPSGLSYNFNTNGQIYMIQDAWGNWIECSYGTNNCLESVTHANGRNLIFSNSWDGVLGEWRIASIQVQGGMSLAFGYNADGQLTQRIDQVGENSYTSSYQYADGFLTNKVNGAGFEYTFVYEVNNGLLNGKGTYLAVDGYYEHEVYYANHGNFTDVTYHRRGQEQVLRYFRNEYGTLEATYGPAESIQDIELRGTVHGYSANGVDKLEETLFDNEEGATWSRWLQYDDAHNVTNLSVSYGSTNQVQQISVEYDPVWNLPSAFEDAEGSRMETIYTNGLPWVVKDFHTETNSYDTYYSYTTNGLLLFITNANGHVIGLGYDSMGNRVSIATEVGPIVTNTYDALGFVQSTERLSESNTPTGRITQYGNNAKGWITEIVFADGLTNSYAYNALGYLTNIVDRAGRTTSYTYAPTHKLSSVTRWLEQGDSNVPVRIGYDLDKQMNLLNITDPRGRYVESYQFDIQDRVTSVTNIENQAMSIDYGVGNFVKQVTRFDGSILTNTYDNAGLKATTTYNAGSANPLTIGYDYYADGQLKGISDGVSTVSNRYDRLHRLDRSSSYAPAFSLNQHADYDHDPVGNVTQSTVFYTGWPWAFITTTSTYDEAERLKTRDSHVFVYNPDNGHTAAVSNTVSGIACSYGYDLMDRITNITYRTTSGSLIRSLDYAYDAASMITNKVQASGNGQQARVAYTYDSLNRLVSETSFATSAPLHEIFYSYDLAGNRLSKITGENKAISYTLDTGNRLSSWRTTFAIDLHGTSTEPIGTDDRWGELWVSNLNVGVGAIPQTDGADFWVDNLLLVPGTNQLIAALRDQAGNMDYTTNIVHLIAATTNMQFQYNSAGCVTNMANSTGESLSLDWDERYRLSSITSASSVVDYSYDVFGRKTSRTAGNSTELYLFNGHHVVADLDSSRWLKRTYGYGPASTTSSR